MLNKDAMKFLAGQIAAVAVLMRDGEFAVCLSSKDVTKEDAKEFTKFLEESLDCGRRVLTHQAKAENPE